MRLAVLRDRIGTSRKKVPGICDILSRAVLLGNRDGHADDPRKHLLELIMGVVDRRQIEREERNLIGLRQEPSQLIAADLSAVIQRHQSAGLHPQNSHWTFLIYQQMPS